MAKFKAFEVDKWELKELRKSCIRARRIIPTLVEALSVIRVCLERCSKWLDEEDLQTVLADEVDADENVVEVS